uniref:Isochorismatase hydrolase n=1 Tax=Tetraselmis sp. GSL018 TaxID=582737 RepID=A0A061S4E7_9CHLO|mmetsp:Transcript_9063/g.21823  ORF Transcript_9063/g.21823 Transcript_9063/m.21823 type:complete len:84 (-) Transcript_9063:186-437(-)
MALYKPDPQRRQTALKGGATAVLFIDTQNFNCKKEGAIYQAVSSEDKKELEYFWTRLAEVTPRWQKIQKAARQFGVEVRNCTL